MMPLPTPDDAYPADLPAERLRRRLLAWYDTHRRDLPWRARPADPYAVLVSEVMLQQTTVAVVRQRFDAFITRFPTVEALAYAELDEVLHAWQGLGYYRRARALHACAQAVVQHHGGELPSEVGILRGLPGIGDYTARAIAAIAFEQPEVPIDGNIARLLTRLAAHEQPLSPTKSELRGLADRLASSHRSGDVAQALIELGALVCTPRRPSCTICPIAFACRGLQAGIANELPRTRSKPARAQRYAAAFLLEGRDGRILLRRRQDQGLLGGMIELPTSGLAPEPFGSDEALLVEAPAAVDWNILPGAVRHIFTHIALDVVVARGLSGRPPGSGDEGGFWHLPERLSELALPSLTRKLLAHAGLRA